MATSAAAALGNDHALVLVLVRDHPVLVHVEYRDGGEGSWHAARLVTLLWHAGVEQRLDDGVFGRGQVVGQREVAAAGALVRLKANKEM